MWEQIKRVRKDKCPTLLFAQTPFDKVLGASNISELKYEWIWEKTQATGHLNSKKMPMKAHENILVFYKELPTYFPQKTQGHTRKVSSAKSRASSETKAINRGTQVYNGGILDKIPDYDSTERYPRDVLKFSKDIQKKSYHPTQKPVELLKYFINTYTTEGQVVLDFTSGSGSTGEACSETNRKFIGIEKGDDPKVGDYYLDVTVERIKR